jgi:hypothetical protein
MPFALDLIRLPLGILSADPKLTAIAEGNMNPVCDPDGCQIVRCDFERSVGNR